MRSRTTKGSRGAKPSDLYSKAATLLLGLLFSWTLAQEVRPDISFNELKFAVGEVLEMTGSGLSPDSDYDLTLTSPEGNVTTEQLSASAAGTADFAATLDEAGRWELELLGEGLDALFRFQVEAEASMPVGPLADVTEDTADATTDLASPDTTADLDSTAADAETQTASGAEGNTPATLLETPGDAVNAEAEVPVIEPTQEVAEPSSEPTTDNTEPLENVTADATLPVADAQAVEAQSEVSPADVPEAATPATETPAPETPVTETPAADVGPTDTPVAETPDASPVRRSRSFSAVLENLFRAIASVGWYSVVAMLIAMLALHLTLVFKYWIPQSVMMRRQAASSRPSLLSRFFAIRYYTFTEKLVFIIMLAATLLLASLAGWNKPNSGFMSWQDAVARTFTNPWTGLQLDRPVGIPVIVWSILIVIFLLWTLFTVLSLFVPRPRLARNAPRSFMYHVLSVLIPGSGLADEMWGILLIVPWALVGIDTLANLFGWGVGISGLSLRWDYLILIAIYLINLAAVIVEFMSYRRRMNKLKQSNPELAEEFGVIR